MLTLRPPLRLPVFALLCQVHLALYRLTAACPVRCVCQVGGEVNCVGTGIRMLPSDLPSNIHALYLGSNLISSINEEYFQDLTHLRELHLDGNRISRIPDLAFHSLERLEVLDLQNNRISQLREHSFSGLASVTELSLKGNRIASISKDVFAVLRSLEKLNLSGNNFKVGGLPDGLFKGPRNLKWLEIRGSGLITVPQDMFKQLRNLTVLNLSENRGIHLDMPSLFSSLQKIETLIIESCELHHLEPWSFAGTINMVELQLSSNSLQEALPLALFEKTTHLRRLQLSSNNLTHLHETLFDATDYLEYVGAGNNPWHCGCGLLGLRARWPNQPPAFLRSGLICQSPEPLLGRDLWSVPLHEMYTSCASLIHRLSTVTIRGKGDGMQSLDCPVPLGSHIAWFTPNTKYITIQTESNIRELSRQNPSHRLLQNGTLLVGSIQPGTYMCSVTFDNGTYNMGGVQVAILPIESPDQSDIEDQSKIHALSACVVLFLLGVVTLAVWAAWRIRRRNRRSKRLLSKEQSFMDMRPQATTNSDMTAALTYDYAYAHPRARIDLTSDESAYAVGRLWEERKLNGRPRGHQLRPISRSVHERGPKYYNDCIRSTLPRTSHTFSGGEVNGYITPSQISAYSMSVKSLRQQVKKITKKTRKGAHPASNGVNPDKAMFRPDSSDNRYLEIM